MSTVVDLSPLPRIRLKRLIESVGAIPWDDRPRVATLLRNLCGPLASEARLLELGLRAGTPERLRSTFNAWVGHSQADCVASVAHALAKSERMSLAEAAWVAETFAAGMGLIPAKQDTVLTEDLLRRNPLPRRAKSIYGRGFPFDSYGARVVLRARQTVRETTAAWTSGEGVMVPKALSYRSSVLELPDETWAASEGVHGGSAALSERDAEWCWAAFLGGYPWLWAHGQRLYGSLYLIIVAVAALAHAWTASAILLILFHGYLGLQGDNIARMHASTSAETRPHKRWESACGVLGALALFLEVCFVTHAARVSMTHHGAQSTRSSSEIDRSHRTSTT